MNKYLVILDDNFNRPSHIMDNEPDAIKYAKQYRYISAAKVYKVLEVATYTKKVKI